MTEEHDQLSTYQRFLLKYSEAQAWRQYSDAVYADPEGHRDLFAWDWPGPIPVELIDRMRAWADEQAIERNAAARAAYDEWVAELAEKDLLAASVAIQNRPDIAPNLMPATPATPRLRLVGDADEA